MDNCIQKLYAVIFINSFSTKQIFLFGLSSILIVWCSFGSLKTSRAKASYLVTLYTHETFDKFIQDGSWLWVNSYEYSKTHRLNPKNCKTQYDEKVTHKEYVFFEQKNHGLSVWMVPIKALF